MKTFALGFLLVAGPLSIASGQDTLVTRVDNISAPQENPYRNPKLAQKLALIPGWGYVYSGEYLKGYATWAGTIGGVALGPVIFTANKCVFALFSICEPGPTWPFKVAGAVMTVGGLWMWISSWRDAPHAAERANIRHDRNKTKIAPILDHSGASGGQWRGGLSVSW